MLSQDVSKPLPRRASPACSATQPLPPDTTEPPIKLPETAVVRRPFVILVVAAEFGIQGFLLLAHRIMSVPLAPVGDCFQPPAESLADRLHLNCELPCPAACADVREAEEVECGRCLSPPPRTPFGKPPKFDQPCLLRVQCQTVLCKPFR